MSHKWKTANEFSDLFFFPVTTNSHDMLYSDAIHTAMASFQIKLNYYISCLQGVPMTIKIRGLWPPRSPDLLDFYWWVVLKDKIYRYSHYRKDDMA